MTTFITPEDLLEHWQGHQRLTSRIIEAFPENQLFSFAPAAPMRSFGGMVLELIRMVEPTLDGFLSGEWVTPDWSGIERQVFSKAELLDMWGATGQLFARAVAAYPRGALSCGRSSVRLTASAELESRALPYRQRDSSPGTRVCLPAASQY
jgi:hypothetical protein